MEQRLLLTVRQVQAELNLSRTTVYTLIAEGSLPVVRFGRSIRIPRKALEERIEQQVNWER